MTYDHHKKAGNQGDVVKHVALLAAIDTLLQTFDRATFRYADTFAGYAYSPLIQGSEWECGIGKFAGKGEQLKQNRHTKLWHEWYLQGRPKLLSGIYPGSSLIANDICHFHEKQPSMALWDVSPEVIANLMETYHGQVHWLCPRTARPKDRSVRDADFLFVDPPGASMKKKKGYPHWPKLAEFFEDSEKRIMVWLPVSFRTKDGAYIEDTKPQRDDALQRGFSVSVVRWKVGVRTVGCQLLYRLPLKAQDAVKAAIEHVVDIAKWHESLPTEVQAVTHHGNNLGQTIAEP